MVIKVDEKGKEMIRQLCDIALKAGGIANLDGVVTILQSTSMIDNVMTEVKKE